MLPPVLGRWQPRAEAGQQQLAVDALTMRPLCAAKSTLPALPIGAPWEYYGTQTGGANIEMAVSPYFSTTHLSHCTRPGIIFAQTGLKIVEEISY